MSLALLASYACDNCGVTAQGTAHVGTFRMTGEAHVEEGRLPPGWVSRWPWHFCSTSCQQAHDPNKVRLR